jgi:cytochrome c oxidase subunit II
VLVFGLLAYFLWRYRESASPPRPVEEDPGGSHRKLEIVWTAFPIVILVIITVISVPVLLYTDTLPPGDVTVHVTAERFVWRFEYEEPGVDPANWTETIGEAWFQEDIIVRFKVTSLDVIHSFALPQLGIKLDAIPGQVNEQWVRVDDPGDYITQCAEFCGIGHYGMRATIHVFPAGSQPKLFGPPPTTVPFTDVELRENAVPPWTIEPATIDATGGETLRLRVWNNNSANYAFRVDPPIGLQVDVPPFGYAWLNGTINVTADVLVPYGPTDLTARANGMVGTLNVTVAVLVEFREYSLSPNPLVLPKGPTKFLLRNVGNQAHNFTMGGEYAFVKHDALIPAHSSVVVGPFDLPDDASGLYWCAVPGHRSSGMQATYQVGQGGMIDAEARVPILDMAILTFAVGIPATFGYVVHHARRREE